MQRTMKYNALSYAIAVSIEATRRVYAAAMHQLRGFEATEPSRALSAECSDAEIAEPKRKRVRVRSAPLTAADIVEGGRYVPKRGNNKTPNYVVDCIDYEAGRGVVGYSQGEFRCLEAIPFADFLALVARKADA